LMSCPICGQVAMVNPIHNSLQDVQCPRNHTTSTTGGTQIIAYVFMREFEAWR
ncbi:unnamed protein product, partial [marine sediment metagenome]